MNYNSTELLTKETGLLDEMKKERTRYVRGNLLAFFLGTLIISLLLTPSLALFLGLSVNVCVAISLVIASAFELRTVTKYIFLDGFKSEIENRAYARKWLKYSEINEEPEPGTQTAGIALIHNEKTDNWKLVKTDSYLWDKTYNELKNVKDKNNTKIMIFPQTSFPYANMSIGVKGFSFLKTKYAPIGEMELMIRIAFNINK